MCMQYIRTAALLSSALLVHRLNTRLPAKMSLLVKVRAHALISKEIVGFFDCSNTYFNQMAIHFNRMIKD